MINKKVALQIANVILNITFIATFIGIFFFTYGKTIEENVVKQQSELIADSVAKDIGLYINKDIANIIINKIQIPDMKLQDEQVLKQNTELEKKAFSILILIAVVGIIISYFISSTYDLSFLFLLKSNLIVLVFVALTEYIFLTYIGQSFIAADPNFVKYQILNNLKTKIQEQNIQSTDEIINEILGENELIKSALYQFDLNK